MESDHRQKNIKMQEDQVNVKRSSRVHLEEGAASIRRCLTERKASMSGKSLPSNSRRKDSSVCVPLRPLPRVSRTMPSLPLSCA